MAGVGADSSILNTVDTLESSKTNMKLGALTAMTNATTYGLNKIDIDTTTLMGVHYDDCISMRDVGVISSDASGGTNVGSMGEYL